MAKKFRLLLLDANIVIELFRHGIWDNFIACCDVHLSQVVIDEVQFFEDESGTQHPIDLQPSLDSHAVTTFDLTPSQLATFIAKFKSGYLEKLDDGEAASLAYLDQHSVECLICSADAIVYRVLGNLNTAEQGISLEEVLAKIGLSRSLTWQFSKQFRERWTKEGFTEGLGGIGTK